MERRKWLWKRKSSDKSPGETESSGSMSSYSERYSDDQDANKSSPNHETQSPEVTSKAVRKEDIDVDSPKQEDINDSVRSLTERLSAALLNVRAKEELVKQHAKVAEEAIAGWEKSENELGLLKQQLGATVKQKSALEDRVSHLDGALKECIGHLKQAREEQEQKIRDAVEEKTRDWESTKLELERQLLQLQIKADSAQADPSLGKKFESLKKENATLRLQLHAQYKELATRTIEKDLSTQAAETASKQHLESIKKMAKLEAECRRLKAMTCKPSLVNDHKSIAASSISIESLTDTQSDNGEQLNAVDVDTRRTERNKCVPSCSDSWASSLIAELNQFGNKKTVGGIPSSLEIDLMDDFLEMERLAALPKSDSRNYCLESEASGHPTTEDRSMTSELQSLRHQRSEMEEKLTKMEGMKVELEEKLKKMEAEKDEMEERLEKMEIERAEMNQKFVKMDTEKSKLDCRLVNMEAEKVEMGEKLVTLEAEKAELETALCQSQNSVHNSQRQLKETEMKLEKLQNELIMSNESKLRIESQLIGMEAEALTMAAKVGMLESEIQKERALALEMTVGCQELEEELLRIKEEEKLRRSETSKNESKIKQEDLAVATGKLAECQKTISSLRNQLKSLATLEDFLIDTTLLPEFTAGESLNIIRDGGGCNLSNGCGSL